MAAASGIPGIVTTPTPPEGPTSSLTAIGPLARTTIGSSPAAASGEPDTRPRARRQRARGERRGRRTPSPRTPCSVSAPPEVFISARDAGAAPLTAGTARSSPAAAPPTRRSATGAQAVHRHRHAGLGRRRRTREADRPAHDDARAPRGVDRRWSRSRRGDARLALVAEHPRRAGRHLVGQRSQRSRRQPEPHGHGLGGRPRVEDVDLRGAAGRLLRLGNRPVRLRGGDARHRARGRPRRRPENTCTSDATTRPVRVGDDGADGGDVLHLGRTFSTATWPGCSTIPW